MLNSTKLPTVKQLFQEHGKEFNLIFDQHPEQSDERKSNGPTDQSREIIVKPKSKKNHQELPPAIKKLSEKSTTLPNSRISEALFIPQEEKGQHKIKSKVKLICKQTIRASMINKIKGEKNIQGCLGHSSIVFKRPIIQGKYYLQFKLLPSMPIDPKNPPKYAAEWRIGICDAMYSRNCPLGQKNSVGFKISSSEIVTGARVVENYKVKGRVGDVYGMLLEFSPPFKYQNKKHLWTGSKMQIYRNGWQICAFDQIYQDYYCPGMSLYNYAGMQVRINKEQFEYLPANCVPYAQIFSQTIPYQNLRNQSIFSEFFKSQP